MELKFTPRTVKEAEDKARKGIVAMVSEISLSDLVIFVEVGLGIDKNQAYDRLESYLAQDGNDLTTLYAIVIKALQEGNFLPKAMDVDQIMGTPEPQAQSQNIEPSQSVGETVSQ